MWDIILTQKQKYCLQKYKTVQSLKPQLGPKLGLIGIGLQRFCSSKKGTISDADSNYVYRDPWKGGGDTQRAKQGKMNTELTSRRQKQGQSTVLNQEPALLPGQESHNSCPPRFDDLQYFSLFAFQVRVFILIVFFLLVLVKLQAELLQKKISKQKFILFQANNPNKVDSEKQPQVLS